jgi:hypothetical protein
MGVNLGGDQIKEIGTRRGGRTSGEEGTMAQKLKKNLNEA